MKDTSKGTPWRDIHEMKHTEDTYEGAYTQGHIQKDKYGGDRRGRIQTEAREWRDTHGNIYTER